MLVHIYECGFVCMYVYSEPYIENIKLAVSLNPEQFFFHQKDNKHKYIYQYANVKFKRCNRAISLFYDNGLAFFIVIGNFNGFQI